ACSRIVSVDSALAGSMNAQVLITTASAPSASGTSAQPAAPRRAIITSLSTRFFAQPSETNETVFVRSTIAVKNIHAFQAVSRHGSDATCRIGPAGDPIISGNSRTVVVARSPTLLA